MDASCRHGQSGRGHNAKINMGALPTAGLELTAQIEKCKDLHANYV